MIKKSTLLCGICLSASSFANSNTLTGLWETTDHQTKQASSVVKISRSGQNFSGEIVKIFKENGHLPTDLCKKCKGNYHNKQILGMEILSFTLGLNGKINNCRILDPNKGSVYHCKIKLKNNGKNLHLRGYIGTPLLGRTDTWSRYQNK